MATSFSDGRSRSTQGESPTMGKQLINFYHFEDMKQHLISVQNRFVSLHCRTFIYTKIDSKTTSFEIVSLSCYIYSYRCVLDPGIIYTWWCVIWCTGWGLKPLKIQM